MQWGSGMPVSCRSEGGYSIWEDPKTSWTHTCRNIQREYEPRSRALFVFSVLGHCLWRQWNYQSETWQIHSSLSFPHIPASFLMPADWGLAVTQDCSTTGCFLLGSSASLWLLGGHSERMMEVRWERGKGSCAAWIKTAIFWLLFQRVRFQDLKETGLKRWKSWE